MKRLIYHILSIILLGAVSCAKEALPDKPYIEGFEGIELEDNCIILKFGAAGLQTKASSSGDENYNENKLNTIDCFFYKTGETAGNAIFRAIGRTVETDVSKDSTECYVKVYYNDDVADKLFGSTSGGTCDVFVIANTSLTYGSDTSLDAIRELLLEYDFSQQDVQPSFAMSSVYTAQVTLHTTTTVVDGQQVEVSTAASRVQLYRNAAKMQLYLDIPSSLTEVDGSVWAPDTGDMSIRLKSGCKKTDVSSGYDVQPSDYISYSYRPVRATAQTVEGKENYTYTHIPFYSYPMGWSDLDSFASDYVFCIPWKMTADAAGNPVDNAATQKRYYKISANVIEKEFAANHYYRTFVKINSRGSEDLDKVETIGECSYIISDWLRESSTMGMGSESIHGDFIRYTYLVVDPQKISLNNETSYTFKFVSSADIKLSISKIWFNRYTSGAAVPVVYTPGTASYTIGDLDPNEYSVTYDYSQNTITFKHDLEGVYEERNIEITVTNNDGVSQVIQITQTPPIYLKLREAGDVFVNGYFGRVSDAAFGSQSFTGSYYRQVLFYFEQTYTGSIAPYYHCNTNLNVGLTDDTTYSPGSGYYMSQSHDYPTSDYGFTLSVDSGGYGSIVSTINNIDATISEDFFTVEVSISAFSYADHSFVMGGKEYDYKIGDPRVKASTVYPDWSINRYLYGANATRDWTSPGDIMICSRYPSDQTMVSPRFLVSSALNANTGLTFEQAVKRGATYQEAGYPAGRWRLPTEAEIAYIVSRQGDGGTIPNLFATGSVYWAGSGNLFTTNADGDNSTSPDDGEKHSCRFIYDLWYWGDTPSAPNSYHPNGHTL